MRARRVRVAVTVPLVAGMVAACGGKSSDPPKVMPGKTVNGKTETGMKLKVETFLDPAKDPDAQAHRSLARRRALPGRRLPPGHRRQLGRHGRRQRAGAALRQARRGHRRGQGDRGALQLRRPRVRVAAHGRTKNDDWNALRKDVCADGPPKPEGIAPGGKKVYFLVTDRGFSERGLRTHEGLRAARPRVQVVRRGRGGGSPAAASVDLRRDGRQRERHRLRVGAGEQRLARADRLGDRDRHRVVAHLRRCT